MSDVTGVKLQNPPKKTKKSLHKTLIRVLGKDGVLMQNRTRAEIINNESDESMSIFNEERKEYFLEHLQESMLHHAAIRDRAEKLAVHMGISIGEATNQLKAHIVQEAAKRRKGNPIDQSGMRSYDKIPDPLSKPQGKSTPEQIKSDIVDRTMRRQTTKRPNLPESVSESFREFIAEYESVLSENGIEEYDLDEATEYFIEEILPQRQEKIIKEEIEASLFSLLSESTSEEFCNKISDILLDEGIHGDIHKGLVGGVQKALQDHAAAVKKHGPDHPSTHEAAYRVKQAVDSVSDHLAKSGYNPQKRKTSDPAQAA